MKKRTNKRSFRKSVKFRPSHDFLKQAVEEYLANGGTITRLEFNKKAYEIFVSGSEHPTAVDDFLNGA